MARNVEIKARLDDFAATVERAKAICGTAGEIIQQKDIFFHCERGRLKLRVFADQSAELIAYQRPDQSGPKTCSYIIAPVSDAASLEQALAQSNGIRAVVRKTRRLFLAGRTRIHLDQVDDLGDYLELEVVLETKEDESAGIREAGELMQQLQIPSDALVEKAYVDLLESLSTRL